MTSILTDQDKELWRRQLERIQGATPEEWENKRKEESKTFIEKNLFLEQKNCKAGTDCYSATMNDLAKISTEVYNKKFPPPSGGRISRILAGTRRRNKRRTKRRRTKRRTRRHR